MTATDTRQRFLREARNLFEATLGAERRELSPYYVKMLVEHRPLDDDPGKPPGERPDPVLVEPFIFLTNLWQSSTTQATPRQVAAEPGSLSLLLGAYGNGKSELIFQLLRFVEQQPAAASVLPQILPISLSGCRHQLAHLYNTSPSWNEFARVLFTRVLEESGLDGKILPEIRDGIRQGKIILILDALDELASERSTYRNFFAGLRNLSISKDQTAQQFRVVVTMRLEYQTSMDEDFPALLNTFDQGDSSIRVHSLILDFFGSSHINYYLSCRVPEKVDLLERVQENAKLLDILRRPLLTKLFVDLLLGDLKADEDFLTKIETSAQLIETYIKNASEAMEEPQRALTLYRWDHRLLAKQSVKIYRNGESIFKGDDIREILVPFDPSIQLSDRSKLSDAAAAEALHKCPFLLRDDDKGEIRLRFAHRGFFEYFISRGLVNGLIESLKKNKEALTEDIDELVLNVDTRKFLADLIALEEDLDFTDVTRRSYGLAPEAWHLWRLEITPPVEFDELYPELERVRIHLLFTMTDPQGVKDTSDLLRDIDWLLKMHDKGEWHPGYLIYNFESIAVFALYRRWSAEGRQIRSRFSDVLEKYIDRLLYWLTPRPYEERPQSQVAIAKALRPERERLLERILHIALRLRLTWVKPKYLEWVPPGLSNDSQDADWGILGIIDQADTRSRIKTILDDIRDVVL